MLAEALQNYLSELQISGRAQRTIENKRAILSPWVTYLGSKEPEREDLLNYTKELIESGKSDSYVRLQQQTIKTFHNWLQKTGTTETNPFGGIPLRVIRSPRREVDTSEMERKIKRLLDDWEPDERRIAKARKKPAKWRALRNWALCYLCFDAGLRSHEVCAIRWRDVDLEEGIIRVEKSKTGFRVVPLTKKTVAKLRVWQSACRRTEPRHYVFPKGFSENRPLTTRAFRRIAELMGLRTHDFRRGCISRAWNSGVPVQLIQQQVGHKSLETTQGYVTQDLDATRNAMEGVC